MMQISDKFTTVCSESWSELVMEGYEGYKSRRPKGLYATESTPIWRLGELTDKDFEVKIFLGYSDMIAYLEGNFEYNQDYIDKWLKYFDDYRLNKACSMCDGKGTLKIKWFSDEREVCQYCRGFGDSSRHHDSYREKFAVKSFSYKALIRLYTWYYWYWYYKSNFTVFSREERFFREIKDRLKRDFGMSDNSIWKQTRRLWLFINKDGLYK